MDGAGRARNQIAGKDSRETGTEPQKSGMGSTGWQVILVIRFSDCPGWDNMTLSRIYQTVVRRRTQPPMSTNYKFGRSARDFSSQPRWIRPFTPDSRQSVVIPYSSELHHDTRRDFPAERSGAAFLIGAPAWER